MVRSVLDVTSAELDGVIRHLLFLRMHMDRGVGRFPAISHGDLLNHPDI